MWQCLNEYATPCYLWKLNGDDIRPVVAEAAAASAKAIAALPSVFPDKSYAWEHTDTHIPAPAVLRDVSDVHSPTPMSAPAGTSIVSTQQVVNLYRTTPNLVAVDSLTGDEPMKQTLPNALWIEGAGISISSKNGMIETNLANYLKATVASKDTPIVSYCLDYECWLSWNTAMRLVAMGYKHVYWYRGGIEAWMQAQLPTVKTVLSAQVY